MSLDRRLRGDLNRDAFGIVVDVERNLDTVEARARRRRSSGAPLLLAAVILIAVALGTRLGATLPRAGSPAETQSTPAPTAIYCQGLLGDCLGSLRPGTYETGTFAPKLSYRVGDGWENSLDTRAQYDLSFVSGGSYTYPDGRHFHDAISFFRRPVAESPSAEVPLSGVGIKASDLAHWLDTHVDLETSGLTAVTVGGAPGYRLEIALPGGPRTSGDHCTSDHGEPRCESLFISGDSAHPFGFGIVGPETAVIYLIDAPSGDTVLIVIDDVDGVDAAKLIAAATPVIDSIGFIAPAASPSGGR